MPRGKIKSVERARLKKKRPGKPPLPPVEHAILDRKRVTPAGMKKYIRVLLAAHAPVMLPETLNALRLETAIGNVKAAEIILKAFEVLSSPGISVTQNNSNAAIAESVGGHKTYDAFVRDRAVEKRMVLEIEPAAADQSEPAEVQQCS